MRRIISSALAALTLLLAGSLAIAQTAPPPTPTPAPSANPNVRLRGVIEVHVFLESQRGTGEGHNPWDLLP